MNVRYVRRGVRVKVVASPETADDVYLIADAKIYVFGLLLELVKEGDLKVKLEAYAVNCVLVDD